MMRSEYGKKRLAEIAAENPSIPEPEPTGQPFNKNYQVLARKYCKKTNRSRKAFSYYLDDGKFRTIPEMQQFHETKHGTKLSENALRNRIKKGSDWRNTAAAFAMNEIINGDREGEFMSLTLLLHVTGLPKSIVTNHIKANKFDWAGAMREADQTKIIVTSKPLYKETNDIATAFSKIRRVAGL